MEKNGSLKVDRFLRVEEIENLFAIGDCNNTPELKLAYLARLQAGKIVKFSRYFSLSQHKNEIRKGNKILHNISRLIPRFV